MDGACNDRPSAGPPMSAYYRPALLRFHPPRFEWDGLAVLGNIFRFNRLPRARSDVRPLFDRFHFTLELFYFGLNLSRARLLAFFECLRFFHIPFNEQILD